MKNNEGKPSKNKTKKIRVDTLVYLSIIVMLNMFTS